MFSAIGNSSFYIFVGAPTGPNPHRARGMPKGVPSAQGRAQGPRRAWCPQGPTRAQGRKPKGPFKGWGPKGPFKVWGPKGPLKGWGPKGPSKGWGPKEPNHRIYIYTYIWRPFIC